ncbi:MAG: DUF5723 family protein [Candidatus Kapaibacterium sp.]
MLGKLSWRAFVFVLLAPFCSSISADAQDRLDPVAMGKARASVASARGIGAIASNPGGLDYSTGPYEPDISFTLYNFGLTVGSTYLSSSDFAQIFGRSKGWPDATDRARLGDLLQDERLAANGANDLFAVRYRTDGGTFGLHYGQRVYAKINFPEDFNTVLVKGELLADHYGFINRGVGVSWMTELGLSYARNIPLGDGAWFPTLGAGAMVKLLQGVAQFEVNDNSILTVDTRTVNNTRAYVVQGGFLVRSAEPDGFDPAKAFSQFETALFPSTSGIGVGGDIGVSGVMYRTSHGNGPGAQSSWADAVTFGMVVQNIGSITWNKNTYQRSLMNVNDTLANGALTNEQFAQYQGTLAKRGDYSTATPAVFRAGLSVNVHAFTEEWEHPLTLDIEGEAPLNNSPGNATDPRVAIGADYRVSNGFAVRTGIGAGGTNGFGIGLGVGVQPLDWLKIDVGTSEINALFNGKRVDLAARLTAMFPR